MGKLSEGTVFAGYRIEEVVGRGGMGIIYRAAELRPRRVVALKVIAPAIAVDEEFRARFLRESQIAASLEHPNVVPVLRAGEEDGFLFIAMRFIRGQDLSKLIRNEQRLDPSRAAHIVDQIADALDAAHEQGLVHRDVKPANVLVESRRRGDHVYLTDFGLSKHLGTAAALTRSGAQVGTIDYIAPEQLEGRQVDARADIYSLGCVLFEALTGQVPYPREGHAARMYAHMTEAPPTVSDLVPDVSRRFDEVVRRALAKQPADRFSSAGELGLAALAAADQPTDHGIESRAAPADRLFPLPDSVLASQRDAFVGRHADLDHLGRVYQEVASKARRIVFLCGEPGIGKTRLCAEVALRVQAAGAVVLYGRCDEIALLPYQPFVEALRHYISACPAEELAGQVHLISGELRRIVPEVAERVPGLALPLSGDPDGARFRLFDAVSALLIEAAQRRPLVLLLDDLQWADTPTLMLFKYLARYPGNAAMLVLGTYRDTEIHPGHPLFDALADLRREHRFERYALAPLDAAAVARLTRCHRADERSPELARIIYEGTEGNPFFVVEVLRHLAERGGASNEQGYAGPALPDGELVVPEGVEDVIAKRLQRLGPETNEALDVASVLGRDFELAIIERISNLAEPRLLDVLEGAVRARVIAEVAGAPGRYSFCHVLIRETLYGKLTAARRAILHRRVALGLEEAYAADLGPHRAELAHHFALAGTPDDLDKAINHGAAAGKRATALLAHEQAAVYFRQVVELINEIGLDGREARRCELVIAQGEAERQAGDPAYRDTLLEGARLAQERQDSELLARAALANSRGLFSSAYGVDRERVSVLQAALSALESNDSATRARLLGLLALELLPGTDWTYRSRLSDEALAMARRVGDPRTLALVLNQRFVTLWGPRTLEERETNADESERLADQLDDPVLAFYAAAFGCHAAMERGDLERSDQLLKRMAGLQQQLRQPIIRWYDAVSRAKRCSINGSPRQAEQLGVMALEIGQRAAQPDARAWFLSQTFVARFLGGTLDCGEPNLVQLFDTPEFSLASGRELTEARSVARQTDALKSVMFCEVGRVDDARLHFDALMADLLDDLPHDYAALMIPAVATRACVRLRDATGANRLYTMLEAHRGHFVDGGPAWFGAVSHHLGLLAATLGRFDEAEYRFDTAFSAYEDLKARAWLARAWIDWAQALLSRRSGDDTERARDLLGQANAAARELDVEKMGHKAAALLAANPNGR